MNAEVIGMFKINPYRPGAGLMPTYLAGRDADMDAIRDLLDALKLGIPTQSVIFSGLRGVGKTVLINKLQEIAEEKGIFHLIQMEIHFLCRCRSGSCIVQVT